MKVFIVNVLGYDEKTILGCLFSEASKACKEACQLELAGHSQVRVDEINEELVSKTFMKKIDSKESFVVSKRLQEVLESVRATGDGQ